MQRYGTLHNPSVLKFDYFFTWVPKAGNNRKKDRNCDANARSVRTCENAQ